MLTLMEAFNACDEGAMVTHKHFDPRQSMHGYRGRYYYEDGACVSNNSFLEKEDWAQEGWTVKYPKDQVDRVKLNDMHKNSNGYMLQGASYEECVVSFR